MTSLEPIPHRMWVSLCVWDEMSTCISPNNKESNKSNIAAKQKEKGRMEEWKKEMRSLFIQRSEDLRSGAVQTKKWQNDTTTDGVIIKISNACIMEMWLRQQIRAKHNQTCVHTHKHTSLEWTNRKVWKQRVWFVIWKLHYQFIYMCTYVCMHTYTSILKGKALLQYLPLNNLKRLASDLKC